MNLKGIQIELKVQNRITAECQSILVCLLFLQSTGFIMPTLEGAICVKQILRVYNWLN